MNGKLRTRRNHSDKASDAEAKLSSFAVMGNGAFVAVILNIVL